MNVPASTQISIAPTASAAAGPTSRSPGPAVAVTGPESFGKTSNPVAKGKPPSSVDKDKKERKEDPTPAVSTRQLMEIQGNPSATAENAAKVQRELSPPENPYPSVQELATVRRAQAMERAARAEIQDGKRDAVDHRV